MTPLLGASFLALLLSQAVPAPENRARDAAEAVHPRPLPLPFPPNTDARLPFEEPPRRPEEPPRRPRRSRPLDPAVLRALAAADPPIDALRAAATALVLAEPARARSLVERARLAGWLPEVRVTGRPALRRAESVDLGSSTESAARAGRHRQQQRRALRVPGDLGPVQNRLQLPTS